MSSLRIYLLKYTGILNHLGLWPGYGIINTERGFGSKVQYIVSPLDTAELVKY